MTNIDLDTALAKTTPKPKPKAEKVMTAEEIKAKVEQDSEEVRERNQIVEIDVGRREDKMDMKDDVLPYLPPLLQNTVDEMHDKRNMPYEMSITTALAFANLVACPHYNVYNFEQWDTPGDLGVPMHEWFVVLQAASGGKSSIFGAFKNPIDQYDALNNAQRYENEKEVYDVEMIAYNNDKKKGDISLVGPKPVPPVAYDVFTENATLNGIGKKLRTIHNIGIFSSEGGKFINSYDKRNSETDAAITLALCDLWTSGNVSKQTGEENYNLLNRRVTMCLLVQPTEAADLVSNQRYADNGYDSRMLITNSAMLKLDTDIDIRKSATNKVNIKPFTDRLLELYGKDKSVLASNNMILQPEMLYWEDDAIDLVQDVLNYTNKMKTAANQRKANGEDEEPGDSLMGKSFEHFLRLAATLCAIEGNDKITIDNAKGGYALLEYYLDQRIDLDKEVGCRSPSRNKQLEIRIEKLLKKVKGWLYVSHLEQRDAKIRDYDAQELNRILNEMTKIGKIERQGQKVRIAKDGE